MFDDMVDSLHGNSVVCTRNSVLTRALLIAFIIRQGTPADALESTVNANRPTPYVHIVQHQANIAVAGFYVFIIIYTKVIILMD